MPTATRLHPARRIGRRVLASPLLGSLTGPHGVDRYVEIVRPAFSLHEARAEVTAVRRTTADSVTLSLVPNANWEGFRAGQFVNVTVEVDGVRETRCYSPAGSAHDTGAVELTVKAHPQGRVSGFLNATARPGMVVGLSAADGDFALPDVRPERLLLLAGGSGITPLVSMLRTLRDEGHRGEVTLLQFCPEPAAAIYRDELDALGHDLPGGRVERVVTRGAGGRRLDRDLLAALAPGHDTAETYVCGPPALLDAARELWRDDDAEARLHVESFLPPSFAPAGEAEGGTIVFARSGASAESDGRVLLEQAEAAGLRPEFGCRMGICHSCTCTKTTGTVRNALSGELSGPGTEPVQICVSIPVGDVELAL